MSELNGTVAGVRPTMRPNRKRGTGTGVSPVSAAPASAARGKRAAVPGGAGAVTRWAYTGVGLCLALSAGLNGWTFAESAPVAWAGWGLGLAVPALVLILSRVSALAWCGGRRHLAYGGCGAVVAMLALSVQHMAVSISRLTGEHVGLAALMAVTVDVGLGGCELATVGGRK